MANSRSSMSEEMMPFGKSKGDKKGKGNPFASKKAPPFGAKKGKKPFGFAGGGSVSPAEDGPTHAAAMGGNPPSKNPLDDGKPSGGGQARGGGAATRGKGFRGTF